MQLIRRPTGHTTRSSEREGEADQEVNALVVAICQMAPSLRTARRLRSWNLVLGYLEDPKHKVQERLAMAKFKAICYNGVETDVDQAESVTCLAKLGRTKA